ncbi:hypothetical protein JL721_2781 [Aureococcus anophagefferens]|nr:hypothetical protein JL721_2781 [Aureococcus anophagefferens]
MADDAPAALADVVIDAVGPDAATHALEERVWVPCKRDVWRLATALVRPGEELEIEVAGLDGNPQRFRRKDVRDFDPSHLVPVDDLMRVNNLSEAPLLDALARRHAADAIYTAVGPVLLSVNPYKAIPGLYELPPAEDVAAALELPDDAGAPHVSDVARRALKRLLATGGGQSVVVSGESSAGKTEASKLVMRWLVHAGASCGSEAAGRAGQESEIPNFKGSFLGRFPLASGPDLVAQLYGSNVVLEAFGNAKTLRNNNSSRFGKYIRLLYGTGSRRIAAATTETFLLEKSRLARVRPGERGYHAFYELLASGTRDWLAEDPAAYATLAGGAATVDGVDDGADFGALACGGAAAFIGILDIFGFEIFEDNSLEQLCISYTNEVLQKQFNEHVFVRERELYAREGLECGSVSFADNGGVLDLIGAKKASLLALLEEQTLLSSKRSVDGAQLASVFHRALGGNPAYAKCRFGAAGFVVKHFAGDVSYVADEFIAKNSDPLSPELEFALGGAAPGGLVAALFPRAGGGGGHRGFAAASSVSSKFRKQLGALRVALDATEPHYVKTIKPNGAFAADCASRPMIAEQLMYSGTLEAVRIRRSGYPVRLPFDRLLSDYAELAGRDGDDRSRCLGLCGRHLDAGQFAVGTSLLFLRDGATDALRDAVAAYYAKRAVSLQNCYRAYASRFRLRRLREDRDLRLRRARLRSQLAKAARTPTFRARRAAVEAALADAADVLGGDVDVVLEAKAALVAISLRLDATAAVEAAAADAKKGAEATRAYEDRADAVEGRRGGRRRRRALVAGDDDDGLPAALERAAAVAAELRELAAAQAKALQAPARLWRTRPSAPDLWTKATVAALDAALAGAAERVAADAPEVYAATTRRKLVAGVAAATAFKAALREARAALDAGPDMDAAARQDALDGLRFASNAAGDAGLVVDDEGVSGRSRGPSGAARPRRRRSPGPSPTRGSGPARPPRTPSPRASGRPSRREPLFGSSEAVRAAWALLDAAERTLRDRAAAVAALDDAATIDALREALAKCRALGADAGDLEDAAGRLDALEAAVADLEGALAFAAARPAPADAGDVATELEAVASRRRKTVGDDHPVLAAVDARVAEALQVLKDRAAAVADLAGCDTIDELRAGLERRASAARGAEANERLAALVSAAERVAAARAALAAAATIAEYAAALDEAAAAGVGSGDAGAASAARATSSPGPRARPPRPRRCPRRRRASRRRSSATAPSRRPRRARRGAAAADAADAAGVCAAAPERVAAAAARDLIVARDAAAADAAAALAAETARGRRRAPRGRRGVRGGDGGPRGRRGGAPEGGDPRRERRRRAGATTSPRPPRRSSPRRRVVEEVAAAEAAPGGRRRADDGEAPDAAIAVGEAGRAPAGAGSPLAAAAELRPPRRAAERLEARSARAPPAARRRGPRSPARRRRRRPSRTRTRRRGDAEVLRTVGEGGRRERLADAAALAEELEAEAAARATAAFRLAAALDALAASLRSGDATVADPAPAAYSVRACKEVIRSGGLSYGDCFEKRDLLARSLEARKVLKVERETSRAADAERLFRASREALAALRGVLAAVAPGILGADVPVVLRAEEAAARALGRRRAGGSLLGLYAAVGDGDFVAASPNAAPDAAPAPKAGVVCEGPLEKRRETDRWLRRWVKLTAAPSLEYYGGKPKEGATPSFSVPLARAMAKRSRTDLFYDEVPFGFEIHSPDLLKGKNREGRLFFKAESEADLQAWLLGLSTVFGASASGARRAAAAPPLKRVDAAGRRELASAANAHGSTALHLLCVDVAAALSRRGADATRGFDSLGRDSQIDALLTKNRAVAGLAPVLPPPCPRVPGLRYATILLEKVAFAPSASIVPAEPLIEFAVVDAGGAVIEAVQALPAPCLVRDTFAWWGASLYVQHPVENLPDGARALFTLADRAAADPAAVVAWATLDVGLGHLATGNKGLEMFAAPVDPAFARPVAPHGAFLSLDVHV